MDEATAAAAAAEEIPSWFYNYNTNETTDWYKEVYRTGFTTDHQVSINGGNDRTKFFTSFGYNKVEGTVTRITPFGAFVQISPAVEALVHISELGSGEGVDPEKVFTLNERKDFIVLEIDKDNRKISLSLADKKKK